MSDNSTRTKTCLHITACSTYRLNSFPYFSCIQTSWRNALCLHLFVICMLIYFFFKLSLFVQLIYAQWSHSYKGFVPVHDVSWFLLFSHFSVLLSTPLPLHLLMAIAFCNDRNSIQVLKKDIKDYMSLDMSYNFSNSECPVL